jgi:hypothetical protein
MYNQKEPYIHYKGDQMPWRIIEKKHPVSDSIKIKYLDKRAYKINAYGRVVYNVRSIQRMHEDTALSWCHNKEDKDQYNNLHQIILSMYIYRDCIIMPKHLL